MLQSLSKKTYLFIGRSQCASCPKEYPQRSQHRPEAKLKNGNSEKMWRRW